MPCPKTLNPLKILAKGDSVGDGSGLHFGVVFLRDRFKKFGYHELFVGTQVAISTCRQSTCNTRCPAPRVS